MHLLHLRTALILISMIYCDVEGLIDSTMLPGIHDLAKICQGLEPIHSAGNFDLLRFTEPSFILHQPIAAVVEGKGKNHHQQQDWRWIEMD